MKRGFTTATAVLVLILLLALTACGDPAPVDGAGGDTQPQTEENTITGTVEDASMHNTTIMTDDGQLLSFNTDNSMFDMKDGLLLGDVITITYTGKIDGTDTAKVSVLNVTDGADNSVNPLRNRDTDTATVSPPALASPPAASSPGAAQ